MQFSQIAAAAFRALAIAVKDREQCTAAVDSDAALLAFVKRAIQNFVGEVAGLPHNGASADPAGRHQKLKDSIIIVFSNTKC